MRFLLPALVFFVCASSAWAGDIACVPSMQAGMASRYADALAGQPTSSGELYDTGGLTVAHLSLPMNTKLKVTNRLTGRSVIVRVNDRGPHTVGRLIDMSQAAAQAIGMKGGIAPILLKVLCSGRDIVLTVPRRKPKLIE